MSQSAASKHYRRRVFARCKGRCPSCDVPMTFQPGLPNTFTIDHIVPISRGGNNSPANKQALCLACNNEKGDKVLATPKPEQLRTGLATLLKGRIARPGWHWTTAADRAPASGMRCVDGSITADGSCPQCFAIQGEACRRDQAPPTDDRQQPVPSGSGH